MVSSYFHFPLSNFNRGGLDYYSQTHTQKTYLPNSNVKEVSSVGQKSLLALVHIRYSNGI